MIAVSGLSFRRDEGFRLGIEALDAANGQVCALVGKNGCGKSTLLRCLAGILPYEGSALVDGSEVRGLGHRERARRLAYLPQDPGCPHMDVHTLASHGRYATLGAVRTMGERDRALVRRAMELTGVWELRDRLLSDVSGGELQRAYLAMIVAQDAGTLLLDEPSAHLDARGRWELARLLRQLAAEGLAVVVATHDVEAAFSLADQVCLMAAGSVVAKGTPDAVAASGEVSGALGVGIERQRDPRLLWGYALTRA
ncbi:MAG: ABC transporter ATP-binding protein [Atopobiaceae bacterium]|jgi:iron complex transport system ATP-binding protein|nr:ABC transporter ATP-binding protein [Atopobiaceae bacterium]MCH4120002.1 ABC transporter ATP-binding protein [Atopobiaceae bacterium]MCI1317961.1 ABC transporter ATP-binding protein [Atopobiaceae bacterium]MCI1389361.1 ABC transporter ATP-binding protein [Atopobiaceae bacterium]MCI1432424.1 ABC transporter ATP-binding protein [Atopobiaceae bacterium]